MAVVGSSVVIVADGGSASWPVGVHPATTAMVNAANLRSIRVAERLGLTPVRKDMLLDNPVVVYAIPRA